MDIVVFNRPESNQFGIDNTLTIRLGFMLGKEVVLGGSICAFLIHFEGLINDLYPSDTQEPKSQKKEATVEKRSEEPKEQKSESELKPKDEVHDQSSHNEFQREVEEYKKDAREKKELREHLYLQNLCTKLAQDRGYKVETEKILESGGRVDVHLENEEITVACEISVTNKPEYEVQNIEKNLSAKYKYVLCMSQDKKHLGRIVELAHLKFTSSELSRVRFIDPKIFAQTLDSLIAFKPREQKILGYRVRVINGKQANKSVD